MISDLETSRLFCSEKRRLTLYLMGSQALQCKYYLIDSCGNVSQSHTKIRLLAYYLSYFWIVIDQNKQH